MLMQQQLFLVNFFYVVLILWEKVWVFFFFDVQIVLVWVMIELEKRFDDMILMQLDGVGGIQLYQDYIVGFFFWFSYCLSWCYLGIGEEEVCVFFCEVEVVWKEFVEDDCCCIDVE